MRFAVTCKGMSLAMIVSGWSYEPQTYESAIYGGQSAVVYTASSISMDVVGLFGLNRHKRSTS